MNRAQRRAAAKATPAYRRGMTQEDKLKALYKNGITAQDLKHDFEKGHMEGYSAGISQTITMCYSAVCLALHGLYGFGRERCYRVLKEMDNKIIYTLTSQELVDETLDQLGIKFDINEPMNRVELTEQPAKRQSAGA